MYHLSDFFNVDKSDTIQPKTVPRAHVLSSADASVFSLTRGRDGEPTVDARATSVDDDGTRVRRARRVVDERTIGIVRVFALKNVFASARAGPSRAELAAKDERVELFDERVVARNIERERADDRERVISRNDTAVVH